MNPILVIDFGSQYTQLISRRLRELGYFSEIISYRTPMAEISAKNPQAVILSGGPRSVYEQNAPTVDVAELSSKYPLFGICYGMQLICHQLGGNVEPSNQREYGRNKIHWNISSLPAEHNVWMSHGDVVNQIPPGFQILAESDNHPAAIENERIFALQFHPEVVHTENGTQIFEYFFKKFKLRSNWSQQSMIDSLNEGLAKIPDDEAVLCALSGGVDSSVVATLLTKKLGRDRVFCVFINNGLLRKNEFVQVQKQYENLGFQLIPVDASEIFVSRLKGLSDPEKKRKIIGNTFIEVFDDEVKKLKSTHGKIRWLAQGTLYPDVIESVSSVGDSVTIKTHHNVGGLPEKMNLKLVEPFRLLFKDEVRKIGQILGVPQEIVGRHPFPGPGLAIRVLGEVTKEKLEILKNCDDVFISFLKKNHLYEKIWQAACILLPIQSVGVQGDGRTYDYVVALRAVTSIDGMTADWYPFSHRELQEVSNQITNQVKGVNRVVYDVTSKPPGTIEWE